MAWKGLKKHGWVLGVNCLPLSLSLISMLNLYMSASICGHKLLL